MVYVLADERMYMDIEGQTGMYTREEMQNQIKSRVKAVTVAFIDCETKVFSFTVHESKYKEELIEATFSQDYLVQEERLSASQVQIIAVPREKIEDIYRYFNPISVQCLVPYPIGLRAFLKAHTLLPAEKAVIFLEDLKIQAVMTIFEGTHFTAPRRMNSQDLRSMASEIVRSQQNFLFQRMAAAEKKPLSFLLVSNNRSWLESLIEQDLVRQEDAIFVRDPYPILEGLKTAKFGIHFRLPQEIAQQAKKSIVRQRLQRVSILLVAALASGGLYTAACIYSKEVLSRHNDLVERKEEAVKQLQILHQRKILTQFKKRQEPAYERFYFDFISNIPFNYRLKEFNIRPLGSQQWLFTGDVFPVAEHALLEDYHRQGLFAKAILTTIESHKESGQRVELLINLDAGLYEF